MDGGADRDARGGKPSGAHRAGIDGHRRVWHLAACDPAIRRLRDDLERAIHHTRLCPGHKDPAHQLRRAQLPLRARLARRRAHPWRERKSEPAAFHRNRPQGRRRPLSGRRGALGGGGRQRERVRVELLTELPHPARRQARYFTGPRGLLGCPRRGGRPPGAHLERQAGALGGCRHASRRLARSGRRSRRRRSRTRAARTGS